PPGRQHAPRAVARSQAPARTGPGGDPGPGGPGAHPNPVRRAGPGAARAQGPGAAGAQAGPTGLVPAERTSPGNQAALGVTASPRPPGSTAVASLVCDLHP